MVVTVMMMWRVSRGDTRVSAEHTSFVSGTSQPFRTRDQINLFLVDYSQSNIRVAYSQSDIRVAYSQSDICVAYSQSDIRVAYSQSDIRVAYSQSDIRVALLLFFITKSLVRKVVSFRKPCYTYFSVYLLAGGWCFVRVGLGWVRYSIGMRRKLGQYFLRSKVVLEVVAGSLDISRDTVIVEVGPGKGALTTPILARYDSVVAVEKDVSLIAGLRERFVDAVASGQLTLVLGDIRDAGWLREVGKRPYAVIANIPYYLTGSLIRSLLAGVHPPVAMSLVVQKEVAERMAKRKSDKESLLSLSVQLFGTVRYIDTVSRRAFSPQPKVDSAIITVTGIQQPHQLIQDAFFGVIKVAFQEKRKTVLKKFADNLAVQKCFDAARGFFD